MIVLVLDNDLVQESSKFQTIICIPIIKLADEEIGKSLFANIVALGALAHITGLVDFEIIKMVVAHRVPPHTVDQNMKAMQVGWNAVNNEFA